MQMQPRPILAACFELGLMALLALPVLTGCQRNQPAPTTPPAEFERKENLILIPEGSSLRSRLVCEPVRVEEIHRQLSAPAIIEADPQKFARIFPPLSGHLTQLHVQLGDTVTQGQLLASLNSADFLATQNDYAKARNAVQLTTRALKRQQELLENKIAAQKDVEQAENDCQSARNDLDSATGRLLAFGFNPETGKFGQPLQIFSPIAGQVVDMAAAHGEFHNDPNAPLMTVADLSAVWLTASVQEKDLRFLTQGQEINASFVAYPEESFTGKVLFVGDMIDPDTRTTKIRIAFPNPAGRLKPGMFATVNFLGYPEKQLTVPTKAIVQSGLSAFVFEQTKPWTFEAREVALGAQQGDRTIIVKGLETGANILTKEGILFQ